MRGPLILLVRTAKRRVDSSYPFLLQMPIGIRQRLSLPAPTAHIPYPKLGPRTTNDACVLRLVINREV